MPYRREGLLLPLIDTPQPDAELLEHFDEARLGAQEVYRDLKVSDEQAVAITEKWHGGQDGDLSVAALDADTLRARVDALRRYKTELLNDPSIPADITQAYRWRINEELANVNMLIASKEGRQDLFRKWNEFIYGKPDALFYHAALDHIAHDAEELLAQDTHEAVKSAAQNVLTMLEGQRGYRELVSPTEETFEAVRRDHMQAQGYYALLLAGVSLPDEGKVTQDSGTEIINHVVAHNLESDYTPTPTNGTTWGISHVSRAVEYPATYNMPVKRFVGLGLGHEIGSHLLEKVNGARGPLALAQVGLDRVEASNEGRALIREQVPYESFAEFSKTVRWRDILRRYIAIGYAHGTNDEADTRHSSSETFAFLNTIDTMYQAKLTPDIPLATKQKANAKTDALLLRILKGTDGKGGAYLKDKVYLEGNVACWLQAALRGPEVISEGDLGKFDITNPRHIALLQRRELLPEFVSGDAV